MKEWGERDHVFRNRGLRRKKWRSRGDSHHRGTYRKFPQRTAKGANGRLFTGIGQPNRWQHHAVMESVATAAGGQAGIRLRAGDERLQRQ